MSALYARVRSWLQGIVSRRRLEGEMEEEIHFHLQARAADLERGGIDPRRAMRQARLEFGSVSTHKDDIRRSLGLRWWDELWSDLHYAARLLRKSPGFTLIAVSSLALAIGANTTIFSVANEMLFERLGVPHPQQLRLLTAIADEHSVARNIWAPVRQIPGGGMNFKVFTYPVYQQFRKQNQVLEDVFGFKDLGRVNVTLDGAAQPEYLQLVSGNFYQQMGIKPQLGRPLMSSDDGAPGTGTVAIISDGYWSRTFGRSPDVLGRTIVVNTFPVTIVGVNPKGFTGAESVQISPDLFMPLSIITLLKPSSIPGGALLSNTELWWVEAMGRIKPGISDRQAQASLDTVLNSSVRGTAVVPKDQTIPHLRLEDGSRGLNSYEQFAQPLYVLLVMVGFVLLLACANVANLMLARASAREREMSVRLALGAGRMRILRQVLTESLLVSAIGGTLGLLLGYLGRTIIPKLLSNAWQRSDLQVPFDWKVFAFTASITIATGVLFGIVPAWSATRAEIGTTLKKNSLAVTRRRHRWSGKGLIAFQICLSTLLVAGAILFLRTLINLSSIDPGFKADHLLMFAIDPPSQRYTPPQAVALHARIEETLRHVPGVEDATLTDVPLLANWMSNSSFYIEGAAAGTPSGRGDASRTADIADVGADFFKVMQIPIIAGRAFTQQDADAGRHVAIINETLAQKFFPGRNPVGMHFGKSGPRIRAEDLVEIIGVCRDTLYNTLRDAPPPVHFDLYRQFPEIGSATYIIRTQMKPEAIVPALRRAVQTIDQDLPLLDVRTQQQQIDDNLQQERMFATLTAGFGLLALTLACVGIYGIMAYTVAQRTNEIGIRLALGAERGQVRGIILREAGSLAVLGVVSGLVIALGLGRLVKSMLYGLQPADPVSLFSAGCLLLGVALVAGWIPAMRASRVQPMEALRHE